MIPTMSSQSEDSSFLTLVLRILGVDQPEGVSPPVDLIVGGKLPVRVVQLRNQWILMGTIATEISNHEESPLLSLLEQASSMWGTLEGTFCYEKKEDILVLWRNISELREQELDPMISRFLEELEFWRTEAFAAGYTGREVFP
ncbi:MAG: hypothetical protein C5B47_00920 [Verrucomicrobia bacterium]|nr:MAG: hypothetical protein C5B47_00920 [Verrucomicrobiota bacterium]